MNDLCLLEGLKTDAVRARNHIDQLSEDDPCKGWFQAELSGIEPTIDATNLSLHEGHACRSALRQLTHLLREHAVRLQNPDYASPMGDRDDSYLTVLARLPDSVFTSSRDLGFSIDPPLLHSPLTASKEFDPVSPTAKVVAYLRGLDRRLQIENCFHAETDGEKLLQQLQFTDAGTQTAMAALFQSRYHTINRMMANRHQGMRQVIEFAAGISPRGYQWSQNSPGTIYIESDLPQLMIHKAKLIRDVRLRKQCPPKGLHHCCAANILDRREVLRAVSPFDSAQPFMVVTEGLLLYFTSDELSQVLNNIAELLRTGRDACWITDFVTRQHLQELLSAAPDVARSVRTVFDLVDRKVVGENPFDDDGDIEKLLAEHGLQIESSLPLAETASTLKFQTAVPDDVFQAVVSSRSISRVTLIDKSL